MKPDVLGRALNDFFLHGRLVGPLLLHTSYGETEEMPVDVFFRQPGDFPELERIALSLCEGRILDVGAGVGSHALYLQTLSRDVTALECSPLACQIMHRRGVQKVIQGDFFQYEGERFDTLLLMMNGIGLAGMLAQLPALLRRCRILLRVGGQVLADSSDIRYLYEDGIKRPETGYYGEIRYQYEYRDWRGEQFPWLYVDQQTLTAVAHREGWSLEILYVDPYDQYLFRLKLSEEGSTT